nr:hypothetical protein K4M19_00412 [Agrobacterium fabrum]
MFTFSVTDIYVVMMRGRLDAHLNGGFRNPHYGMFPGRDEKPGLWLVGDEGVYLMSNGKLAEGATSVCRLCRRVRSEDQPRLLALQAPAFRRR